ncbi:MAG: hypothetical protein Marn2KO_32420 [Marinobacter nauticus]
MNDDSRNTNAPKKTCFIIMPISDSENYETGHFKRVYDHIIKPACDKTGYEAVRADDVARSNYIVIDILRKILDSDLVICDLSDRNPNVLYELGIRQAFNKPTVLLKDSVTQKIFDIQGLRYTEYNQSLRVDSVNSDIDNLCQTIIDTENSDENDINSVIQLLGIKPAEISNQKEVSAETGVILSAINDLSIRISMIENREYITPLQNKNANKASSGSIKGIDKNSIRINEFAVKIGEMLYIDEEEAGILMTVKKDGIVIKNKENKLETIRYDDKRMNLLSPIPF